MSKTSVNNTAAALKGRNVTVTGGLGFIGSNLVRQLVKADANVQVIDALLPEYGGSVKNLGDVASSVKIHQLDLRQPIGLNNILRGQEFIFSLAGQSSHIDSMRDPRKDLEINTTSTVNLLETVRQVCPKARLVYSSTRQVYGRPASLPVTEKHAIQPVDVNGINKIAAEHYYQLYQQIYGIQSTILRLTNTYGPRMDLDSNSKGFVGIFVRKALKRENISIFGDGLQRRDFNHVLDVCNALIQAITSDKAMGEVYNLGFHKHYSLLEFTEMLTKHTSSPFTLVPFPPEHKAIDIGDYYGSYQKFANDAGWQPQIDLAEGLAGTIAFFRDAL